MALGCGRKRSSARRSRCARSKISTKACAWPTTRNLVSAPRSGPPTWRPRTAQCKSSRRVTPGSTRSSSPTTSCPSAAPSSPDSVRSTGWRRSCSTPRRSRSCTEGCEGRARGRRRDHPARGRGFRRAGARLHPGQLHERRHHVVLDRVGDGGGGTGPGRGGVALQTCKAGLGTSFAPLTPALSPEGERVPVPDLGRSSVESVPVGLAFDAARCRRLVLQPGFRYAPAAAFADPVGAFAQPLQGALDLLPVLVEQVYEQVRRLPVGQRLGEVRVLWNPCDHAAGHVVQRAVQAGLLAALRGQELQPSPVSFEPLRRSVFRLLPNCHCVNPPPNSLPGTATFGFRESERLHRHAYPLPHN